MMRRGSIPTVSGAADQILPHPATIYRSQDMTHTDIHFAVSPEQKVVERRVWKAQPQIRAAKNFWEG